MENKSIRNRILVEDVPSALRYLEPILEAIRRTTDTVFHASLNSSPGNKLTDEQLRVIANKYMQKMGYGDQPYIVFKHKDIDLKHLHIVSFVNFRMISRHGVLRKLSALWSANTACTLQSKDRNIRISLVFER